MASPERAQHHCPACGKAVDPLRAGQVAILGGTFSYFCDLQCKLLHLRGPSFDQETAAPPLVAYREPRPTLPTLPERDPDEGEAVESRVEITRPAEEPRDAATPLAAPEPEPEPEPAEREEIPRTLPEVAITKPSPALPRMSSTPAPPPMESRRTSTPPPPAARASRPPETRSPPSVAPQSRAQSRRPREGSETPPPRSVRESTSPRERIEATPMPAAVESNEPRRPAPRRDDDPPLAVALFGIACAIGATSMGFLGSTATLVRLPLVLLSALAVVAWTALSSHAARARIALFVGATAPILAASLVAVVAYVRGATSYDAVATLASLSSMVMLGLELFILRQRRTLRAQRKTLDHALSVNARVRRGSELVIVAAGEVEGGETVIVREGETVGVDGAVANGAATVMPWPSAGTSSDLGPGDLVHAGARVSEGELEIVATAVGDRRAWLRFPADVEALEADAPLFSRARLWVLQGTLAFVVFAAVAAYATSSGHALDVIAAAAAAWLSVPLLALRATVAACYFRAATAARTHGVVIPTASVLERAARVDVLVLAGRSGLLCEAPEVTTLELLPRSDGDLRFTEAHLRAAFAGAEAAAPDTALARALSRATRGEAPASLRNVTFHPGLGVRGDLPSGERLLLGGRSLMLTHHVSTATADARVAALGASDQRVIYVAVDGRVVGIAIVDEAPRALARGAVQRLLDVGIEPILISGETREVCESAGTALDIEHIRAEILPADRPAEIERLAEAGHLVAVLGHPTEDAPMLLAASVGVARGKGGPRFGESENEVTLVTDDVRAAAQGLGFARAGYEEARRAVLLAAVPGALTTLAVVFGIAPIFVAPLGSLLGGVLMLAPALALRTPGSATG